MTTENIDETIAALKNSAEYGRAIHGIGLLAQQYLEGAITEKEFTDSTILRLSEIKLEGNPNAKRI